MSGDGIPSGGGNNASDGAPSGPIVERGAAALADAAARLRASRDHRSTPQGTPQGARGTREDHRAARSAASGGDRPADRYTREDDGDPATAYGPDPDTDPPADQQQAQVDPDSDPSRIVYTDETGKQWTAKEVREGILRQSDYTAKTQETARRAAFLSQTQGMVDQAANLAVQVLPIIQQYLSGQMQPIPPRPDPALEQSDPLAYFFQVRAFDQAIAERQAQLWQLHQFQLQHQNIAAAQQAEFEASEERELINKLPAWRDPATRTKEMGNIVRYCQQVLGRTDVTGPESFRGVNHALLLALRDAELGQRTRASWKKGGEQRPAPGIPGARPLNTLTGQQATRGQLAQRIVDKRSSARDRELASVEALQAIGRRGGRR